MTTTTKHPRSLRLTALTPDLTYVVVSEGKRIDSYRLDVGFSTVRWVHTGDARRGGIVCVNGAGKAVGCDCPAGRRNRPCRHKSGTSAMIGNGSLDVPVVTETRDAQAEQPEGWMYSVE